MRAFKLRRSINTCMSRTLWLIWVMLSTTIILRITWSTLASRSFTWSLPTKKNSQYYVHLCSFSSRCCKSMGWTNRDMEVWDRIVSSCSSLASSKWSNGIFTFPKQINNKTTATYWLSSWGSIRNLIAKTTLWLFVFRQNSRSMRSAWSIVSITCSTAWWQRVNIIK